MLFAVPATAPAPPLTSLLLLSRRCRSRVNQYEKTSLIKIENVNQKSDVDFYLGKKCAPRRRGPQGPPFFAPWRFSLTAAPLGLTRATPPLLVRWLYPGPHAGCAPPLAHAGAT